MHLLNSYLKFNLELILKFPPIILFPHSLGQIFYFQCLFAQIFLIHSICLRILLVHLIELDYGFIESNQFDQNLVS